MSDTTPSITSRWGQPCWGSLDAGRLHTPQVLMARCTVGGREEKHPVRTLKVRETFQPIPTL